MRNELEINTTYIPHLQKQYELGRPILFLGAGFSLGTKNRQGKPLPSGRELTQILWDFCYPGEVVQPNTELKDIYETARLQNPNQLKELMEEMFLVDPSSCAPWYEGLLTMPWCKIYTLNIDNLVEVTIENSNTSREAKIISAATPSEFRSDDGRLQVIHLNGTLKNLPHKVVFSRLQYAASASNHREYELLASDLLHRPVVFIGTELDEPALWHSIQLRSDRPSGERELRPRSYLVTPQINKSKLALLARYNTVWLEMTGEEFYASITSKMNDAKSKGLNFLNSEALSAPTDPDKFEHVGELMQSVSSTQDYFEYLLGAKPEWKDLLDNRIAQRDCFEEFIDKINEVRSSIRGRKVIILTGTAGSGKSSALMYVASWLESEGVPVAWLDANATFSISGFKKALEASSSTGAIFIDDADIYSSTLSSLIQTSMEINPRMIFVCEMRSNKVDACIDPTRMDGIDPIEYTIPNLLDNDIDSILAVLEREKRLGDLKSKSMAERKNIFKDQCGRQLLVAMYTATHGVKFEEKVEQELTSMPRLQKAIYGTICVASANRLYLRKEDVAIAFADEGNSWLTELSKLENRKMIMKRRYESFSGRHRIIDQFIMNSLQESGEIFEIVRRLIRIGASKTTPQTKKSSQRYRLLKNFTNHNFLKRVIGLEESRTIYGEFENMLDWSSHFWLHRGALELEAGQLDRAENFLKQSKSIDGTNLFIDTELAYLELKKALLTPNREQSRKVADEAVECLIRIGEQKPSFAPHAYHILGTFSLDWYKTGIDDALGRRLFLNSIHEKILSVSHLDTENDLLEPLARKIKREFLGLAVNETEKTKDS